MHSFKFDKTYFCIFNVVFLILGFVGSAFATDDKFGAKVRNYLLSNPEVLIEAMKVLDQRQAEATQNKTQNALESLRPALSNFPWDVVLGNPNGDVTVIEFFDYRCGWCQRAHHVAQDVLKSNPDVKLVMKQFPVLGPGSVAAARLAMAARKQNPNLYAKFHTILLDIGGQLPKEQILKIAQSLDLDIEKLSQDSKDPEISAHINRNYEVAQQLDIKGTPAFIIGSAVQRGFLDYNTMMRTIQIARENKD